MPGLPNPSSCERLRMYDTRSSRRAYHKEILPGGAHFGRILMFDFIRGIILFHATVVYPILASFKMYDHGGTKSTVSPFECVSS